MARSPDRDHQRADCQQRSGRKRQPGFLAQGFDLVVVEGEFSEQGIGSGVCSAAQELHDWNPASPGEDWRLAWLGETEDGLAAWFVRPLAIAARDAIGTHP